MLHLHQLKEITTYTLGLNGAQLAASILKELEKDFILFAFTLPANGPLTRKDLSRVVICSHLAIEGFKSPA